MTRKFIINVGLAILIAFQACIASEASTISTASNSKTVITASRNKAKLNHSKGEVCQLGTVTAEELNAHFAKYDGSLKGKGHVFIEMEQKYGVSARFMAAIATQESGCGSSARAKRTNDAFGMTGFGNKKWSSVNANIESAFSLIDRVYVKKGRRNVAAIGKKYCVNKSWPTKIIGHMRRI